MSDTAPEPVCPDCDGEGTIDCMSCNGQGVVTCVHCGGDGCPPCDDSGYEDCEWCEGSAEQDCPFCDGTGNAIDTLDASDSEAEDEPKNDHEFLDKPKSIKPKGD